MLRTQEIKSPHLSKIKGTNVLTRAMPVPVSVDFSEFTCKPIELTSTWHAEKGLILHRNGGMSSTEICRLKVFPLKGSSLGSSSSCPPWSRSSDTTSCSGRGGKSFCSVGKEQHVWRWAQAAVQPGGFVPGLQGCSGTGSSDLCTDPEYSACGTSLPAASVPAPTELRLGEGNVRGIATQQWLPSHFGVSNQPVFLLLKVPDDWLLLFHCIPQAHCCEGEVYQQFLTRALSDSSTKGKQTQSAHCRETYCPPERKMETG